jgi:hypothetical protein
MSYHAKMKTATMNSTMISGMASAALGRAWSHRRGAGRVIQQTENCSAHSLPLSFERRSRKQIRPPS